MEQLSRLDVHQFLFECLLAGAVLTDDFLVDLLQRRGLKSLGHVAIAPSSSCTLRHSSRTSWISPWDTTTIPSPRKSLANQRIGIVAQVRSYLRPSVFICEPLLFFARR
jgi:hypothetical protein